MSTSTERLVEKFGEEGLPTGKVAMMFNVGDQTFTSRDCWNHLRDVRGKNLDARDASAIVGARGPRMKLKVRNIVVEMLQATSPRKEAAEEEKK